MIVRNLLKLASVGAVWLCLFSTGNCTCTQPPTCKPTLIVGVGQPRYNCPAGVKCTGRMKELRCLGCERTAGTGGAGGFDSTLRCSCKLG